MQSVSIGEIQKNISLLTQLSDALTIVDRRKNQNVAIVYPIKKSSIVASMSGKYKDRVSKIDNLKKAKEEAMREVLGAKYGLSS